MVYVCEPRAYGLTHVLVVADRHYDLSDYERVFIVGAISMFDDVAARFIHRQLYRIYSTRVEAGSPGGVGDKLADGSQTFKSARKGKSL